MIDAGTVSATITTATGGNFENLAINPAAAATTITDTIDTTTVSADRHAEREPKAAASSTPPRSPARRSTP